MNTQSIGIDGARIEKGNKVVFNLSEDYFEKPVMFMMVGIPASGKTLIAHNYIFVDDGEETIKPVVISSDDLRKELFGDENVQNKNDELFNELHKRIKNYLNNGVSVIYDATNINKKKRIAFLKELKNIDCYKVCICVMTPYDLCLKNNKERERSIPEEVIKRMYLNWCPPIVSEGFDYTVTIINEGLGDDIKYIEKYTLNNFFNGEIGANNIDQENSHHNYTIGTHCIKTYENILNNYPEYVQDTVLMAAALLHDCGKPFTKTHINSKGEYTEEAHYYGHHHCGAYDSIFYLNDFEPVVFSATEELEVANLIYYHMHPFREWKQNEKIEERDRKILGEDMYNKIIALHEADIKAK